MSQDRCEHSCWRAHRDGASGSHIAGQRGCSRHRQVVTHGHIAAGVVDDVVHRTGGVDDVDGL